jgi:hypothetical protein
VAVVLLVYFAGIYPLRDYYFPVGPDVPVYLWWTKLAAHDGLSAVGVRPGVPILSLLLQGSLGLSPTQALAGVGTTAAVSLGLAAASLVATCHVPRDDSSSGRRWRVILSGILAGTFAVHLAEGFYANLLFAALFIGAACSIAAGTRRGAIGGGALLGASGLAHPLFFALGVVILGLAAIPAFLRRPRDTPLLDTEAGRITVAMTGGGLITAGGLAALLAGPGILPTDTSQDAFLRRAGFTPLLRREYAGRLVRHLARYVLELQVPLAIVGLLRAGGFVRRFLTSWGAVVMVGSGLALATGLAPAVRFFSFAYVFPILTAIGLVWLWRVVRRRTRAGAVVLVVGLVTAVVLGATFTWLRTRPFLSRTEVARATEAGEFAAALPPGTPLVFLVENERRGVSFLATRADNVIRAALPADRIRDAHVYVGLPENYVRDQPTILGMRQHDEMSRVYLRDIHQAGGRPVSFVLAPFNRPAFAQHPRPGDLVAPGVLALSAHSAPVNFPGEPLGPSSSWGLATSGLVSLLFVAFLGFGWAWTTISGAAAVALAPAFGVGVLVLVGVALERMGVPVTGWGPGLMSGLTGAAGYAAALWTRHTRLGLERHTVTDPPPEIDK